MKVTSEPLPASASSERARMRTVTYRSWARDWSHSHKLGHARSHKIEGSYEESGQSTHLKMSDYERVTVRPQLEPPQDETHTASRKIRSAEREHVGHLTNAHNLFR